MRPASASVSVIIPAYNASAHIGEAIASVLAQRHDHLEIIVVDDGSQDGTADLVAARYPRVRLFRKANGGAATARNAGIRVAEGAFIAFLDADDLWLPGKLAAQLHYLERHPDIQLLCTRFSVWRSDETGRFPAPESLQSEPSAPDDQIDAQRSGWLYHRLLLDCTVWTSTVVMRRGLLEAVGKFDESLRLGQDYDYWLRASRLTQIHTLARPFALYRQHPASVTARGAPTSYGAQILTNAMARWGVASPNGDAVPRRDVAQRIAGFYFDNGFWHYQRGDDRAALAAMGRALKTDPLRINAWGYSVSAVLRLFTKRLRYAGHTGTSE